MKVIPAPRCLRPHDVWFSEEKSYSLEEQKPFVSDGFLNADVIKKQTLEDPHEKPARTKRLSRISDGSGKSRTLVDK